MPEPLPRWFASYDGDGLGQVRRDGFPEPYIGDLQSQAAPPRLVILGLHPGQYYPQFQARDGIFADEIRQAGCYSAWARSGPYLRAPWIDEVGPNLYSRARLAFTCRWLQDSAATYDDMLIFEAYPWHLTTATAPMHPPPNVVDEFVWQPIVELPVHDVFAFGRAWNDLATTFDLPLVEMLGAGGRDYGSVVASRAVRIYELSPGQRLIVEWHSGSAGPPKESEVAILRQALS